VASRILPVKIHDLDPEDKALLETELEGILRSIEFIYKSAGVNRPLRANEDHPHDNLNKTYYRDQINKVANAIKGIISCLNPDSKKQISRLKQNVIDPHDFTEPIPDSSSGHLTNEVLPGPTSGKSVYGKLLITVFSLIILILGVIGFVGWFRNYSDRINKLTTYSTIPVESTLMDSYGRYPYFSISPDGRIIAYGSDEGIYLRSLSDFSIKLLEETEGATQIAFSPDGQYLAFEKEGYIFKTNITGSQKTVIHSMGLGSSGIYWGSDMNIYFGPGFGSEGIWKISANGGEPEQITSVVDSMGENSHWYPQLLPDSKTLILTALGPSYGSSDSRIIVKNLESGERKVLIDKAIFGRYLFNDYILFANEEGYIFTIPFNIHKLKVKGEAEPVLSGVNTATAGGAVFLSVSETGNLVFLPRDNNPLNIIDVVDRAGKLIYHDSIPITTLERMGHGWSSMSIAPSGNSLAVTGRSYSRTDIWLLNLNTGITERITFDPAEEEYPVWSPDGNAIAYTAPMNGNTRRLFVKDLRIADNPRLIRTWPLHLHLTSWSSDGKWLAAYEYTSTKGTDCYAISVDSSEFIPIASGRANESNGQFSFNGKWLAFQSDETGRSEIYVVSFPRLESKRQISEEGGELPHWDRNGKFIYYISNGYMIANSVESGNEFRKGKHLKLFLANASNFEVSPDGQKFYLARKNDKRPNQPLHLITNWFGEIENKSGK